MSDVPTTRDGLFNFMRKALAAGDAIQADSQAQADPPDVALRARRFMETQVPKMVSQTYRMVGSLAAALHLAGCELPGAWDVRDLQDGRLWVGEVWKGPVRVGAVSVWLPEEDDCMGGVDYQLGVKLEIAHAVAHRFLCFNPAHHRAGVS